MNDNQQYALLGMCWWHYRTYRHVLYGRSEAELSDHVMGFRGGRVA